MPIASTKTRPISVALVDDYDVVVMGVANILGQYREQVVVAELDANTEVDDIVDIALYDSFAQPESDHDEIKVLIDNPRARRVVVYTWNFAPDLVDSALQQGVSGYLSKALPARELVAALCAIHNGEVVVSNPPGRSRSISGLDWPRPDRRLVKSYFRTIYRKIGVGSRTQAVLWGVKNGFTPDRHRIDHWRGGP